MKCIILVRSGMRSFFMTVPASNCGVSGCNIHNFILVEAFLEPMDLDNVTAYHAIGVTKLTRF